jgi:hypothetical protein
VATFNDSHTLELAGAGQRVALYSQEVISPRRAWYDCRNPVRSQCTSKAAAPQVPRAVWFAGLARALPRGVPNNAMTARRVIAVLLGLVALVAIGLVGFSLYFYRYSRYSTFFRANSHVAIARALEQRIQNKSEYVPPAGNDVADDQIARFLKVEHRVESTIGPHSGELQQAFEEIERKAGQPGGLTVRPALKSLGGIGSVFNEARQEQVAAMNATGFSRGEFEWVRRRLYAGAGVELSQIDLEGLSHVEDVEESVAVRTLEARQTAVADARLQQHADTLRRWRPMAFFGF